MPQLKGRDVAGMMTQGDEERAQGVPPMWRTYVNVASADATAKKVAELGGTVLAEPFDVMDFGRMGVFFDTEGAFIAAWEAKSHIGAGIVNEPGAFCWSELITRAPDTAKAFYTDLFGWSTRAGSADADMDYTEWRLGDRTVGGMLRMTPEMGDMPPCWTTYFAVDDTDAAVATATGGGGTVFVPPTDIPTGGRFAVLADPRGAVFAIIKMDDSHQTSST